MSLRALPVSPTSSDSASSAIPGNPASGAPPSDSQHFNFACRCLNVQVEGRVPVEQDPGDAENGESSSSVSSRRLWMGKMAEVVKHSAYVTWDISSSRRSRKDTAQQASGDKGPSRPCWRKCWLCETHCYRSSGKRKGDPAISEGWVVVEISTGILLGRSLETTLNKDGLPFSGLSLELPSTPSSFARPPQTHTPALYPPTESSRHPNDRQPSTLIPLVHDPFFLPPPFVPAHPHLRGLCSQAVTSLNESRGRLESEIKEYIALKTKELREREETVRWEVEYLWTRYKDGPGKDEINERERERDRRRSTSTSRPGNKGNSASRGRKPSVSRSPDNLIIAEAIQPPVGGTSLLGASLSANTFYAPQPASQSRGPEAADKSLETVQKNLRDKDAREVAMSHVFSTLDEAMGPLVQSKSSRRPIPKEDLRVKNGWFDEERVPASKKTEDEVGDSHGGQAGWSGETSTSRSVAPDPAFEEKAKGKSKAVTFEEPSNAEQEEMDGRRSLHGDEGDIEGAVFDFEEDEPRGQYGERLKPARSSPSRQYIPSSRNPEEELASKIHAKDAPSHRSAWTTMDDKKVALYDSFRRQTGLTDDEADDEGDSSDGRGDISKLATSMPAAIVMPSKPRSASGLLPMERKTSLGERNGILVPPLLAAMRERGINQSSQRNPSRTEQIMLEGTLREREGGFLHTARPRPGLEAVTGHARPRPALEPVADENEGDNAQGEGNGDDGTVSGVRGFVLPGVPQDESGNQSDVGWKTRVASWASRLEGKKVEG